MGELPWYIKSRQIRLYISSSPYYIISYHYLLICVTVRFMSFQSLKAESGSSIGQANEPGHSLHWLWGATGGQQGEWAGGVSGSGWDVNDAIYASVVGSSSIVYSRTVYSRTVYVEL